VRVKRYHGEVSRELGRVDLSFRRRNSELGLGVARLRIALFDLVAVVLDQIAAKANATFAEDFPRSWCKNRTTFGKDRTKFGKDQTTFGKDRTNFGKDRTTFIGTPL